MKDIHKNIKQAIFHRKFYRLAENEDIKGLRKLLQNQPLFVLYICEKIKRICVEHREQINKTSVKPVKSQDT